MTKDDDLIRLAGRRLAEHFHDKGLSTRKTYAHKPIEHLGALLAATILQGSSSFERVVKKRIARIEEKYPSCLTVSQIRREIIEQKKTHEFLELRHGVKTYRFERFVELIAQHGIESRADLKEALKKEEFCKELLRLDGIGNKSIDFLKINIGLFSIAVDKSLKQFALSAGVNKRNYNFLRDAYLEATRILGMNPQDLACRVGEYEAQFL